MHDYQKLRVWQKARELTVATYDFTRTFPPSGVFGMVGQLRRSAASIVANVAEGAGRATDAEFARFIRIASGSACEYEAHVLVCRDVGLIGAGTAETAPATVAEIKRMLHGLVSKLGGPTVGVRST